MCSWTARSSLRRIIAIFRVSVVSITGELCVDLALLESRKICVCVTCWVPHRQLTGDENNSKNRLRNWSHYARATNAKNRQYALGSFVQECILPGRSKNIFSVHPTLSKPPTKCEHMWTAPGRDQCIGIFAIKDQVNLEKI